MPSVPDNGPYPWEPDIPEWISSMPDRSLQASYHAECDRLARANAEVDQASRQVRLFRAELERRHLARVATRAVKVSRREV